MGQWASGPVRGLGEGMGGCVGYPRSVVGLGGWVAYTCGCYTLLDFPSLVTLMHKNIPTALALLGLVSALIKVIVNCLPEVIYSIQCVSLFQNIVGSFL